MRLSSLLGAAAVALVASFASANAQQPQAVRIGVLECHGGQNVGMVVASALKGDIQESLNRFKAVFS